MKKWILALGLTTTLLNSNAIDSASVQNLAPRTIDILEKAVQSVVFIANEYSPYERAYGEGNSFFYNFCWYFYEAIWPTTYGSGSGFLISDDGYIVTNDHVVDGTTKMMVAMRTPQLRVCRAKVVGTDSRCDVALLKVEAVEGKPYPFLKFADSNKVRIGDQAYLIGNPISHRYESSLSSGVISSVDRPSTHMCPIEGFMQFDASSNSGASGGPLLDKNGDVIGVNSRGVGYLDAGINFAVTSNVAKKVVKQFMKSGEAKQGYLGVTIKKKTENAFEQFYFEHTDGALIYEVLDDTPAKAAGLQKDDLIIAIDGTPVAGSRILTTLISTHPPETTITLTILRDGQEIEKSIMLTENQYAKAYLNYAMYGYMLTL
ncbi:MAG: trypsin-like peptidase domain-containing protein [Simkaniaceae bacterium]|nr:trypsin-like peptidase domain-containing protein [Simkaniaceae bacterium]